MTLADGSHSTDDRSSHGDAPTAAVGTDGAWPLVERRSGFDRRLKRHFVFMDRRTGFDRRRRSWFFGTMHDSRWVLISLLVLLNVFSLMDGALTALELRLGIAKEGNPLFANIIQTNGFLAAGLKVAVMIVISAVIWRWREHRSILAIVPFALALYAAVLAYHFGSLAGLYGR
jgi:hypothetical protein